MREVIHVGVRGGSIRVECIGHGTPILLLHGWALDHRIWTPQFDFLSARFRLIAIDRRGFGASTAPPGLAAETGDILTILNRLGIDRAVLVGMSQGGRIALRFSITHPERVSGLLLQGAPLDGFAPEPRRQDAIPVGHYRTLAGEGRLAEVKSLWRDHELMQCGTPGVQDMMDLVLDAYQGRDLLTPGPDNVVPLANRLAEMPAPALILTGEHDTSWRQLVGDALAYGLPDSRRVRLAGADHLCNLTHPEAYNATLTGFLDEIQPGAAQGQ
jgi:pimeloyl-ACP methyl ester carboxylesterase